MHLLWKYLKPHKWLIVVSLFLAGLAQLLTLIDPVIFGKIIDDYATNTGKLTEQERVNAVIFWLTVAVVIALLARACKTFQEYLTRLVVQKFGISIFNDGLSQTLKLSYQEFEGQRSGETLSTLQKVKTDTERFINAAINILFSSLIGIAFLIWYAVTKHWMLIPVFLVGVAVLGGLTGLLSKKIKTLQRSINRETYQMSGAITESLRNIELVKSLGLIQQENKRLQAHTKKIFDLELTKVKKVRMLTFLQSTALTLLRQSILFILLWLIFRDVLTTGELISMQFISTTIFGPLQDLGNIILSYREAEASVKQFDRLMEKPIEPVPVSPYLLGDIHSLAFSDVVFKHNTASYNAINSIRFSVSKGQTIAFVGPSGSGKSTLVKLLVGLYQPLKGKILFNNISANDITYNDIRKQIGFVTQDTQLFYGTIKENLLFVKPDATDQEIADALDKAACTNILQRSPDGLNALLGEGGMKLSGGEKQRIAIARALLRRPNILIFDEATSALDSLTEDAITTTIRSIADQKNCITILIAHRLSTVMHADEIYVLEKGSITEHGNHTELVSSKGLYYAMWRQQIGERRPTSFE